MTALQAAIAAHVPTLPAHTPTPWEEIDARWLGAGVALTFLFVVLSSGWAMRPRTFTIAPTPPELLEGYWNKSDRETKEAIIKSRVGHYKETAKKVNSKAKWMVASFIFVAIESLLLVLILLVAAKEL